MALSIDVQAPSQKLSNPTVIPVEDPFPREVASVQSALLRNLSISNPGSVQSSPVATGMQSSLFSPQLGRRSGGRQNVPPGVSGIPASSYMTGYASGPDRGGYNIPAPSHSNPYNVPTSSTNPYDLYGGTPSSLPTSAYLLTRGGGASGLGTSGLGGYPSSSSAIPRQSSVGPSPRSVGGSPNLPRRMQHLGGSEGSRPQLMRQHRSLDSEFPPADPYFHPMGSGIDFPVTGTSYAGAQFPSGGHPGTSYAGSQFPSGGHPGTSYAGSQFPSGGHPPTMTSSLSASANYGAYNQPLSVSTATGAFNPGPLSNPGTSVTGVSSSYGIPPGAMPTPTVMTHFSRDPYSMPVPVLQREYDMLRREYENSVQKLNSSMNSIKTFWSPELKKERTFRKEESSKLNLLQEQLKMATQENQRQQAVTKQLQDELQCQYELHRTFRDTDVQSVSRDEYNALRLERDRLHRELQMARDTVRELEVQIESQRQTLVSRDESIKKLLDMLQGRGQIPFNSAQEHMELEQFRGRVVELENRCRNLESSLSLKDQDIRALQEECMNASEKLRQAQANFERARAGVGTTPTVTAGEGAHMYQGLLNSKEARIEQLERQLSMFEEEVVKLRDARSSAPREFTDHMYSDVEFRDMKLKLEKTDMELTHKSTEVNTLQTRLITTEEQLADVKKHLEVVKEANSAKEQQINLLQSDIEALRSKLESKNETIDTKQHQVTAMQTETNRKTSEISDLNEQMKIRDGKLGMQQRKVEGLEELLKEKERELESVKERLQNSPAMQQQRKFEDQLEELIRERDRLGREMRDQREKMESDRIEQLETHRREVRDLRMGIESLQKEISDRQVLIESQNEKISDLNRELQSLRIATHMSLAEKAEAPERMELERLNTDLHQARTECDKLLKMVQTMEKDKDTLNSRIKDMQRQLDDAKRTQKHASPSGVNYGLSADTTSRQSTERDHSVTVEKERRIEELEEALRESVSITAEREFAIAQQKQLGQQLEQKMTQYRDALNQMQRQYEEMNQKVSVLQNDKQDKDSLIRSMKHERRKHLEEVLSLKQEALVAAVSEKDAHIALLEMQGSNKSPEELHTLKKHKEKLMRKLKEENEKRVRLLNENKADFGELSAAMLRDLKASPIDQLIQTIRWVELQKKKLRLFIDQLVACILDLDPDMLTGLPRTQQIQGIDMSQLGKLPHEQLLIELNQRQIDLLQLQYYAHQLLQRLAQVEPRMVHRAIRLLESFDNPSTVLRRIDAQEDNESFIANLLKSTTEEDDNNYNYLSPGEQWRESNLAHRQLPRLGAYQLSQQGEVEKPQKSQANKPQRKMLPQVVVTTGQGAKPKTELKFVEPDNIIKSGVGEKQGEKSQKLGKSKKGADKKKQGMKDHS